MMRCVKCGEMKERTTDFFTTAHVHGDLEKWFENVFPLMSNCASRPCNACFVLMTRDRLRDTEGDGWLYNVLAHYKLPISWAKPFYALPVGVERCWATGGTLPFQKGSNAFSLGVNSTLLQTENTYDQNEGHDIKSVVPVYHFANCRQTVNGSDKTKVVIIPELRKAYTELYRRKIEAYQLGHTEMLKRGDMQAMKMKSREDFHHMSQNAKKSDKKRGLENNMLPARILAEVRAVHAICFTSGIIMETFSTRGGTRGPYDVHMDRIEDGFSLEPKGHVDTNVEFKCRLFNNEHYISPKDFLLLFLNQVLVPLPEDVRAQAQKEYDEMPCSSRDAWKHETDT